MTKWEHGSSGYTNHACRCEVCRRGHAGYITQLRWRRAQMVVPEGVDHGASTYTNWGCRCDECKQGHRDKARTLRKGSSK